MGVRSSGYIKMSASDVDADPRLAITCREHLAQGDATELLSLLDCLTGCSTAPWVHRLNTDYYKRWWIGSLLDWVQRTDALSGDDYAEYEILFLKVLRGWNCGTRLSGLKVQFSDLEFPVMPKFDNGGARMGVWTPNEVDLFLHYTKHLLSLEPRFGTPPTWQDEPYAGTDDEWNDWVYKMLAQRWNL